ncbi:proline--tRNA ligase [bacterium]|nr:proline--tRNA ligase [candidate division CSSED10-310 bacterium]
MRMSELFCHTYREEPSEAQTESHKYLLKAGFIQPLAAGIYTYLPFAVRVMAKIQAIIREEMNAIGGQEILMPVMQPAELWMETGRYQNIGSELVRFKDRAGRQMVLAMTHEEVVTDLARRMIMGHRGLPFMTYQIQVKIRDEPRSRGGLIRVREFHMKDAYSFHRDAADLDRYYPHVYQAYTNIFQRCGIEPLVVEADPGMMGGSGSHEFMCVIDSGEDTLVKCNRCGYAANIENAFIRVPEFEPDPEELPIEEVATPGRESIADVAAFLSVPESKTLKAVFYNADGSLVFVAIRGDFEVNETKLMNILGVKSLELAEPELLSRHGMVAGYASPLDLPADVRIVADRSLEWGNNFVAGANKPDYHLRNINIPRDLQVARFEDILTAREGAGCPRCDRGILKLVRGIELGHIFKLGTKYTDAMDVTYLDEDRRRQRVVMGCYGIGVGRLMSAVVEVNHDENGICWPRSVAPFEAHLVSLSGGNREIDDSADALYGELRAAGIETLYDDRDESPGVKFNDADLIGCPLRITVSTRSLRQGGYEMKGRRSKSVEIASREQGAGVIQAYLDSLEILTDNVGSVLKHDTLG